ncbi:hypothetical protein [Methylobacterium nodulans]|uniref:Uncharacterized protein n=1 Tax=Methylobacterium nodulans (strain LMG 21967 / CNCM I-2342 / ORS 2060) TaxID=460265 RepID=B8ISP4_METNO|nr:hypothetical protein [Methylobacterium nodulans]ACL60693.1 conserved hypothetical protein [Methylobacterium nodulans ORS 2060]
MRHAFVMLFLLGPLAGTALAQGAPRSVADCERIRGDLAYNQCLSLFGPAAPTKGAIAAPAATEVRLPPATAAAEEAEPAPTYRGRRRYGRRIHRGRQSASFAVVSSGRHRRR